MNHIIRVMLSKRPVRYDIVMTNLSLISNLHLPSLCITIIVLNEDGCFRRVAGDSTHNASIRLCIDHCETDSELFHVLNIAVICDNYFEAPLRGHRDGQ